MERSQLVRRATWVGLWVNVGLVAVKLMAGWVGHSQAVVADGVHSLSDLATDLVLLIGIRYWTRPPDRDHAHGHARIENMVAAAIALLLAVAGVNIGRQALASLFSRSMARPTPVALFAALLSVAVKEWLYRWTRRVAEETRSQALKVNAWHHRTDALSSIPAALAVGLSAWSARAWMADALGALLVSGLIFWAAWELLLPQLRVLSDASAGQEVVDRVEEEVKRVPGIRGVHSVRTRIMGSGIHADLHITVDPELTVREGHEISERVRAHLLGSHLDVRDVVVHLEPDEPHED